jgi:ABC-type polysaccharide/polyol phosphate transport system ATPase subunit
MDTIPAPAPAPLQAWPRAHIALYLRTAPVCFRPIAMPPALSDHTASAAVSLRGVSKHYTVWSDPAERLLAPLRQALRGRDAPTKAHTFTAVRDVSLDIQPGECLGIVGRNGAGKSTLLQMIAGTLRPSTGDIAVHGRVAALLELGSGFNPDFTGRENIHLYASILGLAKAEIDAKYDAIVAYAGIGDFIHSPIRTYSTGMAVRLAFAVCVHVDADILIIDEALAVGDARFQFKCHATLEQMQQEGRTIIFVSHDTNAVKRMCRTAVLLERGEVLFKGAPNDVVNLYTKLITSPHGAEAIRTDIEEAKRKSGAPAPAETLATPASASPAPAPPEARPESAPSVFTSVAPHPSEGGVLIAEERAHQQVSDKEYAYGGEAGKIVSVAMTDEQGRPRLTFVTGATATIRFTCEAFDAISDPIYAVTLKDVRGLEIFGTNSFFQSLTPPSLKAGEKAAVEFAVRLNVQPGVYFASLGWVRLVDGEVHVIHRRYDVLRFDVMPLDRSFGIAHCPVTIRVGNIPA